MFGPWEPASAPAEAYAPLSDVLDLPPFTTNPDLRPVDPQLFKRGMRYLASGCSVIASQHGDDRAGLTATAVCSITAEPPRLLVCINRNVRAHAIITRSRALSVNLMACEQLPIAQRFAGMVPGVAGEERFAVGTWERGSSGAPIFRDALVSFDCQVTESLPASTHSIFLCDVIDVAASARATGPLVYFDGRFSNLNSMNDAPPSATGGK